MDLLAGLGHRHRAGVRGHDQRGESLRIDVFDRTGRYVGSQPIGDRAFPGVEHATQSGLKVGLGQRELEREVVERASGDLAAAVGYGGLEDGQNAFASGGGASYGLDPSLVDFASDPFLDDRQPQALLGREVVVERAAGDAGLPHDVVHAGRVVAVCLEGLGGSIEDAAPGAAGIVGTLDGFGHSSYSTTMIENRTAGLIRGVVELRQYTLRPGRRDELIELFEREFVEPQQAAGMALCGLFRDADRPDRFVWVRAFEDMEQRRRALETFYTSSVWLANREAANATMLDSDNVLLLRPLRADSGFSGVPTRVSAPLLCAIYSFDTAADLAAFAQSFDGSALAAFVTEPSTNTFARLPVREGEHVFVAFTSGVSAESLRARRTKCDVLELVPTQRSAIQLELSGRRSSVAPRL